MRLLRRNRFIFTLSLCLLLHVIIIPAKAVSGPDDDDDGAMRFTYGDKDGRGPTHWKLDENEERKERRKAVALELQGRNITLENEDDNDGEMKKPSKDESYLYRRNHCKSGWLSPINIKRNSVNAPDLGKAAKDISAKASAQGFVPNPETLIFEVTESGIEHDTWTFGHPLDNLYHGIEIRSSGFWVFNLVDNFDPLDKSEPLAIFDFHFLTIFYCNLLDASKSRSMHQIDGQRFPLELHFVFLKKHRKQKDYEDDAHLQDGGGESAEELFDGYSTDVTVVVQGELGPSDNKYFQPVVEAARKFRGMDFNIDKIDDETAVQLESPWSATWLLPDSSGYYYYDGGSFPVPPCWKVARYYIMLERIQISSEQLDALTNIETEREKESGNKLACTFSLLQNEIPSSEVTLNTMDYEFLGEDKKPRSPEEKRKWEARRERMKKVQRLLEGKEVTLEEMGSGAGRKIRNKKQFAFQFIIHLILTLIIFLL